MQGKWTKSNKGKMLNGSKRIIKGNWKIKIRNDHFLCISLYSSLSSNGKPFSMEDLKLKYGISEFVAQNFNDESNDSAVKSVNREIKGETFILGLNFRART